MPLLPRTRFRVRTRGLRWLRTRPWLRLWLWFWFWTGLGSSGRHCIFQQVDYESLHHLGSRCTAAHIRGRKIRSNDLGVADFNTEKPKIVVVVLFRRKGVSQG